MIIMMTTLTTMMPMLTAAIRPILPGA